jgi:hypothetical protein
LLPFEPISRIGLQWATSKNAIFNRQARIAGEWAAQPGRHAPMAEGLDCFPGVRYRATCPSAAAYGANAEALDDNFPFEGNRFAGARSTD